MCYKGRNGAKIKKRLTGCNSPPPKKKKTRIKKSGKENREMKQAMQEGKQEEGRYVSEAMGNGRRKRLREEKHE